MRVYFPARRRRRRRHRSGPRPLPGGGLSPRRRPARARGDHPLRPLRAAARAAGPPTASWWPASTASRSSTRTGPTCRSPSATSRSSRRTCGRPSRTCARATGSPAFPLAGQLDLRRIVVAGHSRGAAGAILAAQSKPAVSRHVAHQAGRSHGGDGRRAPLEPAPARPAGAADHRGQRRRRHLSHRRFPLRAPVWAPCRPTPSWARCTPGAATSARPNGAATAEVSRDQDWAVTNAYAVAFLKYVTGQLPEAAGVLFGAAGLSTTLTPLGVLRRSDRGARVLIDDFQDDRRGQRPGAARPTPPAWCSRASWPGWARPPRTPPPWARAAGRSTCSPRSPAFSRARQLGWSQDGALYGNALGNLDVGGPGRLRLPHAQRGRRPASSQVSVRLVDASGKSATVDGSGRHRPHADRRPLRRRHRPAGPLPRPGPRPASAGGGRDPVLRPGRRHRRRSPLRVSGLAVRARRP